MGVRALLPSGFAESIPNWGGRDGGAALPWPRGDMDKLNAGSGLSPCRGIWGENLRVDSKNTPELLK
eukprot:3451876-Pyramimonas_sp.AAC.1